MSKQIKNYETPELQVFELHSESVLCTSVTGLRDIAGDDVSDQSDDWN